MDKIDTLLNRGVEKIYPSKKALEDVLRSKKKIRVYQGFDPSMPNLHLGNTVGLLKLKQFQDLGHKITFLIGDFTGMIGDPTGKSSTRPQLTKKEALKNSKNWKNQAEKILDFGGKNPAKILFNSRWLERLDLTEFFNLASLITYQQVVKREMFKKRLKKNEDIFLHEFLYPFLQGYDSVAMNVDLEIGGSDQMFNMLIGRDLMKKVRGKDKLVMTTKLLVDKKGEKVGKTAGNALFLNASAVDMFGGVMSFPDEAILPGFELLTETEIPKGIKKDPMKLKKKLAFEVVKIHHSEKLAEKAQKEFEQVFQKRKTPSKMPVFQSRKKKWSLVDLLVDSKLTTSKSEAKRLIKQGAVDINGKTMTDINQKIVIKSGDVVRCGKRKFIKIK